MKILLTGATGYIGKRLLAELIHAEHEIHCLVRNSHRLKKITWLNEKVRIHEVDLLSPINEKLTDFNYDVAFYLIHSMTSSTEKFDDLESKTANNFVQFIKKTNVKQIVYLSGIVNEDKLSKHLESRKNVEDILRSSNIPVTVLRAGIIIGSGSASFEIIRDLVEKLPVMIAPKWLNTKCQPIAVRDVIKFLKGVMLNEKTYNNSYDIGGPDILTYKQMLIQFAEVRGYKRYIITLPVLTPRLSSYWLYFITSTSYKLAVNLVDSMKVEVICKDNELQKMLKIETIPYSKALELALEKIENKLVLSSWKDALVSSAWNKDILEFIEVPENGVFIDVKEREIKKNIDSIIENIWTIGGNKGWYYANWLWNIRGFLDKIFGGVGLRRGRRSDNELHVGDTIDFWRVIIADKEKRRMLLYAEMKLPGEAWLEFNVYKKDNRNIIQQTATFRPKGLFGRLYWYSVLPFHYFIFNGMINNIAK